MSSNQVVYFQQCTYMNNRDTDVGTLTDDLDSTYDDESTASSSYQIKRSRSSSFQKRANLLAKLDNLSDEEESMTENTFSDTPKANNRNSIRKRRGKEDGSDSARSSNYNRTTTTTTATDTATSEDDDTTATESFTSESKSEKKGVRKQDKEEYTKQQEEMKQMKDKFAKLQQDTNERTAIDSLITNRSPEFCERLPVAGPVLFKLFTEWNCFNAKGHAFPSKVISSISKVIESSSDDMNLIVYWLNNCFVLLYLLHANMAVDLDDEEGDENLMRAIVPKDAHLSTQAHQLLLENNHEQTTKQIAEDDFTFETPVIRFKNEIIQILNKIYKILIERMYKDLIPVLIPTMFTSVQKS
jgi:hypothetical protein